MSTVNLNDVMELLSEYQEGELSNWGKAQLKDELISLSEQLFNEDVTEGRLYEEHTISVQIGAQIPQPYQIFSFKSGLTNKEVSLAVKEITSIFQNEDGSLIIDVLARKL